MYDFEKIKLVIWDLDDTLWTGTLSEGEVELPPEHQQLLRRLVDIGIMNSICSKNDLAPVRERLMELGLWDCFVFPSVNWQAKGQRLAQLIALMQLRPANVLFVDDNPFNLEEARFFSPELMTALPGELPRLLEQAMACTRLDPKHSRLQQYRILEEKQEEKQAFSSNEEFLYHSGIQLELGQACMEQLDRIHELLLRSNQLNFTKLRPTKQELQQQLQQPGSQCGYVTVRDRFGDYGLVGFYALQGDRLLHFCFSCRTLGMGIEQYVYNLLKRPALDIVGEVISSLECTELPGWINQKEDSGPAPEQHELKAAAHSVLMKGPCDLFQILPYIGDKSVVDTEFTYKAANGVTVESTGHTTHIVEALRLSQAQKELLAAEVPFVDLGVYDDAIYRGGYRLVVISILADANLGVYQRRGTGERLAFVEGFHPITDPQFWPEYIAGSFNSASFRFTEENLREFARQYEFVGINSPEQIVENLRYIRQRLPRDCGLAVMLGGELYYERNTFPAYEHRHETHKKINDAVRALARTENIELIDVNRYLVDQSSFYDHFNHYIKPVYYQLAGELVTLIEKYTGLSVKKSSRLVMLRVRAKELLAPSYHRGRELLAGLYRGISGGKKEP